MIKNTIPNNSSNSVLQSIPEEKTIDNIDSSRHSYLCLFPHSFLLSTMPASDTNTSTKVYENDNDVVTINAGGKIFQVLRSTLCQPHEDTKFHKLFRTVDTTLEGPLFMDHDPEFIEIILNFLRMKKIEDPFDPIVEPPQVPSGKTKDFKRLLNHFDLTAFFYYPSTIPDATPSTTLSASQMQKLHRIRKMSLDSSNSSHNEDGHFHKSSQDSISSVDASITNEFDYCYG